MFFIGIFGVQSKQKKIGEERIDCNICSSKVLTIIKSYTYFHLFFIPIFKWNIEYYALCENCNAMYSLSNEKGEDIERGNTGVLSYWDLKDNINNKYLKKKCSHCGRNLDTEFEYCPYCGNKIN